MIPLPASPPPTMAPAAKPRPVDSPPPMAAPPARPPPMPPAPPAPRIAESCEPAPANSPDSATSGATATMSAWLTSPRPAAASAASGLTQYAAAASSSRRRLRMKSSTAFVAMVVAPSVVVVRGRSQAVCDREAVVNKAMGPRGIAQRGRTPYRNDDGQGWPVRGSSGVRGFARNNRPTHCER